MALLILALLQRIFLMSSLMLLLVWLIFFMVLIKRSEERFSRNAETDLVCRLLLEKKKKNAQQQTHVGPHDIGPNRDDRQDTKRGRTAHATCRSSHMTPY